MSYPNRLIQSTYNRYPDAGFVGGEASLQNCSAIYDNAPAGVDLAPGDGVYIDTAVGPTQGQWILPAPGAENLITHIISFEQSDKSTLLTPPVGNQSTIINFSEGRPLVKAMADGAIYVRVGATPIIRGQSLQFDVTTQTYILNTFSDAELAIIALADGAVDEVVPVRISRINQAS